MFCRNCGNHLDGNNKVCNKCGTNNNPRTYNNSKGLKLFLNRFKQDSLFANKMLCKLFFLHEILIIITFICMAKITEETKSIGPNLAEAFILFYSFCRILPALIEHFISKRYLQNRKYKLLKAMYILSIISWIVSVELCMAILGANTIPIILRIPFLILTFVDTVLTLLLRLKKRQEKIIHKN